MKIVYVSQSYIPSREANSIHVMQMCSAMAGLGHDVTLLAPDAPYRVERDVNDSFSFYGVPERFTIRKLPLPRYKGNIYVYSLHVARELSRIRPDLVVGRFLNGCWAAAVQGYPTVFDSHGPIWETGWIRKFLLWHMIRRRTFRKLTVNSHALGAQYRSRRSVQRAGVRVQVAPNGANFVGSERADLPGASTFKAGYFGHLYPGRGIDLILDVAKRLPDVDFMIVGGTEEDIRRWASSIEEIPNAYSLGFVPPAEVYAYRNACDVLLAPYQRVVAYAGGKGDQSGYMNPIKLLEYMSSAKPIVASDLPGVRETLSEETALLVECDDADAWAEAIRKLQCDPELARSLAERAYREFSENYTWTARARALIE